MANCKRNCGQPAHPFEEKFDDLTVNETERRAIAASERYEISDAKFHELLRDWSNDRARIRCNGTVAMTHRMPNGKREAHGLKLKVR